MSARPGSNSQRTLYLRESLVAFLLLSLAFADAFAGQALTLAQIAGQQSPTVVTITTEDGFGSGVIVEATGLIVTNLHVIQGSLSVEVKLSSGDVYDDVTVSAVDSWVLDASAGTCSVVLVGCAGSDSVPITRPRVAVSSTMKASASDSSPRAVPRRRAHGPHRRGDALSEIVAADGVRYFDRELPGAVPR